MTRAVWIGIALFGAWLFSPDVAHAQTCEPRTNVPSYEAGKPAPIICDLHGSQHVKILDGSGNVLATVASAAAPTLGEGQTTSISVDLAGNARMTLGTCLSGESACVGDSPTSYIMVRTVLSSSGQKTADAQIKATAGYVSHMICQGSDAAATAGTIILHDETTETGTAVFTFTVAALDYHTPMVFPIQANFATGIYLGFTTTADMACTVFYQ